MCFNEIINGNCSINIIIQDKYACMDDYQNNTRRTQKETRWKSAINACSVSDKSIRHYDIDYIRKEDDLGRYKALSSRLSNIDVVYNVSMTKTLYFPIQETAEYAHIILYQHFINLSIQWTLQMVPFLLQEHVIYFIEMYLY
jgi:hypothetical protein